MHRVLITLAAAGGLALSASADAQRRLGTLVFEPCTLTAPLTVLNVEAQCTRFEVPENPSNPAGRKIELAVAWVPTENSAGADDPLFMIAGGPGQSALESYPGLHGAFREIRKNRHVILVDQRGTGGSNKLTCTTEEGEAGVVDDMAEDDPAAWRAFAERCRDELGRKADLTQYTTSLTPWFPTRWCWAASTRAIWRTRSICTLPSASRSPPVPSVSAARARI
jgi:pimeloyl-ACP methyl ester carboxylesterase